MCVRFVLGVVGVASVLSVACVFVGPLRVERVGGSPHARVFRSVYSYRRDESVYLETQTVLQYTYDVERRVYCSAVE